MHHSSVWLEFYTADTGDNLRAIHAFPSGYFRAVRWLYIPAHLYKLAELTSTKTVLLHTILFTTGLTDKIFS